MPATELMTAVFKDAYNPAKKHAVVEMSRNGKRGHYNVQPKAAARLPSGTVVLVLSGVPVEGPDTADGLLSVCFLSGKALLTCRENVAELDAFGQFGNVHFISLGEDKPALAITHGEATEVLSVFALEDNQVHNLTRDGIRLSTGKLPGTCDGSSSRCWSVNGQWRLDRSATNGGYRAIEVEFSGRFVKGSRRGMVPKGAMARYEVVAGQYKRVKGSNFAPET